MSLSTSSQTNADPAELAKFDRLAHSWWDPQGDAKPLHDLNPVRLRYVADCLPLRGACVLDVGCGGGLLAEAMAGEGAAVIAIDLAAELVEVAKRHALESGRKVDYRLASVEALAVEMPSAFDLITCMEMLEHVPDPESILGACAALLKPGGRLVFSTINRTPRAFAFAIVGAEYLLGLLPRGTHHYAQFLRPAEMAAALRRCGLELNDVSGLQYQPFSRRAWIDADPGVNYLGWARKR